jgi:cytoskeletal protein RodZ
MDEQRMLAEIERRLSAEDPRLAARLSSFRRPGPAATLRSPRGRIIGSLFTVALVAVISMMVYAMVPFRAHGPKTTYSPQASTSAVHNPAPSGGANTSASATGANTRTSATVKTPKTSTVGKTVDNPATKTTAGKTGSRAGSGRSGSTPANGTRATVPPTSG